MQLTPRQIRALSVEADTAEATVRRRLAGLPVRPSTSGRLDAAAKRLGLPLPAAKLAAGWGVSQGGAVVRAVAEALARAE